MYFSDDACSGSDIRTTRVYRVGELLDSFQSFQVRIYRELNKSLTRNNGKNFSLV